MRTVGLAFGHSPSLCIMDGYQYFHKPFEQFEEVIEDIKQSGCNAINYYERPWLKKSREILHGQWSSALDPTSRQILRKHGIHQRVKYHPHHRSHVATVMFFTAELSTMVIVADAIGEWDTVSIWHAKGRDAKKLFSVQYPFSLGLFYSAFTKLIGYPPNQGEHNIIRLATRQYDQKLYQLVTKQLHQNNHKGILDTSPYDSYHVRSIASAVQQVFIDHIYQLITKAASFNLSDKLIITGGCAMNPGIRQINQPFFKTLQVCDYPTDLHSSIGAAYLGGC